MGVALRDVHVELSAGAAPLHVDTMWTAAVGEGYFEAFDVPLVAGRHFQSGDRAADARTVLVNEAFARRYLNGATPIGRRVRYGAADPARPNPWLEIVGMVRDVGMTPTDLGEAPYVFRAVSPTTAYPLVMGIRVASDATSLGQRVRFIAAEVDRGLRLAEIATLDDLAWRQDLPQAVIAAALAGIVVLGLFMSAAGIFSLMSVSVARRTREIGLRAALGASTTRLLGGIFAQAIVLIGSGVAAGNGIILLFIALSPEVELAFVWQGLVWTSAVMLTVGLLACVEPARRALRIQPTDALRDV
jgi:putative ABC transport system permease protein